VRATVAAALGASVVAGCVAAAVVAVAGAGGVGVGVAAVADAGGVGVGSAAVGAGDAVCVASASAAADAAGGAWDGRAIAPQAAKSRAATVRTLSDLTPRLTPVARSRCDVRAFCNGTWRPVSAFTL
jgi:hypothetical protein